MKEDIREKLKNFKDKDTMLSKQHALKFKDFLAQEMHQQKSKKNHLKWLSIAASIVLLISIGIQWYPSKNTEKITESKQKNLTSKEITLGNISPEFQTIETYYTNSIKLELSQLDLSEENREIVDEYLLKISELTKEYKLLTQELNTKGVNDTTIDALIRNLQLRLQLLQRLKKQLEQLKNLNTQNNETQII
ncbi:hypothetical protein DUT90_06415 [Polaribacter sp. WD7]|uniref:hypothetical protein n=1 Tax=Polaribacter sp. WD7 TaxID=2269061 RepID=UPI000DF4A321|nr:hypothetical protein [Polaribacter sp. WD7]RCS26757.1 hypothetical protein DUT90_06415 [Polaribacter sp. WD7]